jgi:pimeloyl-ACP methyl ester carboxylesterase
MPMFAEAPTAAAWMTIPSWFLIGRQDRAIDPAALRFMAQRAHGHTTEIDASHLGLISHADDDVALPMAHLVG